MELVHVTAEDALSDWRETLRVAVDLSLPNPFNVEWLIDRAETGEWGGLWW